MLQPMRVGLLGLGTVGSGTVNVLSRNRGEVARRAGREIMVTNVAVRDITKQRQCDLTGIDMTGDPFEIVADPNIEVVVELIGGTELARELVLQAIAAGKHVVTANKALIAIHGNEIFSTARAKGISVVFESAVAGGIPIVKAIREGLAGNRIEWLAGIINGTGNFILSEMRDKGREFADVLAEAQALGYAEADPTMDVEGIDAAHKLAILAAIAFGKPLQFDAVYCEGISRITPEDIAYADDLGYRIKHLGIARRSEEGVELRVHPCLVPARRLIANVDGVMNAILVKGDAVGSTLYYGAGAGAEPTASAVVADLVDVARTLTAEPDSRVPHLAFQADALLSDLPMLPITEVETAYYLRLSAEDRPGVLGDVAGIIGASGISIEAIIQKEPLPGEQYAMMIMLTHRVQEKRMVDAIRKIESLDSISGSVVRIRVEQLDANK